MLPVIQSAFPVTEPVALFALLLGVILLAPMLFERLRLPGFVGLLLAGVVIGPHGLHLVERGNPLILLATVGLLYVMFIAGLEIDLVQFKKYRQCSIFFGLLSFAIPQVLGTAVALAFGFGWMGALLLGSVLASHTLLAYPIVSRMGLGKRLPVTTAVGGTILTDLLALLVLVVVAGGAHGELSPLFWARLVGALGLYALGIVWGVPRLARAFFKNVGTRRETEFVFVLGVMFATAFLAKAAGIEAIVGAFLAGLMLNRFLPEHSPLLNRVQFVGNALFIPFFLLATGMLVDVRILASDPTAWTMAGVMTGIVLVGKLGSSWVTGAWYGYSPAERLTMFGLTVPQAAATLAATLTGHKLGLLSTATVNGVIVMILVTCTLGPALVQHFGRKMAQASPTEPERVEDVPERILVPFANPETAESLLDLAAALRSPGHQEPVLPLMVVRPEAVDTQAKIALAEKHLAHAALHLAGAEVPVSPLTRVGLNVASMISQAAIETRSSTVILGWNGETSLKEKVFGSVIDQVLEHESAATLVAHLRSPLGTTEEVVVLVPPLSERHPGFVAAMRQVKQLTARLGARLTLWTIGASAPAPLALISALPPEVALTHIPFSGWREATRRLRAHKDANSLIIFLSAREGDLSWQPILAKLPHLLADAPTRNFLVLYPAELVESPASGHLSAGTPEPRHEIVRLQATRLDEAYAELYERARALCAAEPGLPATPPAPEWSEATPGALVVSTRVPNWPHVVVVIGLSEEGVRETDSEAPIKAVFLCLMPADMPLEQQSAYMKWLSSQVARSDQLERLCRLPPAELTGILRMTRIVTQA